MRVSIRHVDTCLSSFVLDHCNGERETLLGVPVDGSTTRAAVKAGLLDEWRRAPGKEGEPSEEDFRAALDEQFSTVSDMSAAFDSSLDAPADLEEAGDEESEEEPPAPPADYFPDVDFTGGETCYAWFRVSWTADGEE